MPRAEVTCRGVTDEGYGVNSREYADAARGPSISADSRSARCDRDEGDDIDAWTKNASEAFRSVSYRGMAMTVVALGQDRPPFAVRRPLIICAVT